MRGRACRTRASVNFKVFYCLSAQLVTLLGHGEGHDLFNSNQGEDGRHEEEALRLLCHVFRQLLL